MNKIISLFLAFFFLLSFANAQSFFSKIRKPVYTSELKLTAINVDSIIMAIRPVVVPAAYMEPGNILSAGAGFGYNKLSWNATNQSWTSLWSVSAIGFAGGSLVPSTPASIVSVGMGLGLLNNTIIFGPAYNFQTKWAAFLSFGINFNN
jgi:hypothetical protein